MITLKMLWTRLCLHLLILVNVPQIGHTQDLYQYQITNYLNLISSYEYNNQYSIIEFIPIQDATSTMAVDVSIGLLAINGFDEVAGNIEIVTALNITWLDETPIINSISFQKGTLGGNTLLVSPGDIWTPKILLVNAIGEESEAGHSDFLAEFDMDTYQVVWRPRSVLIASCTPNVEFFPYDRQLCEFTFSAWGFLASEVELTVNKGWDFSGYSENGEWEIVTSETESFTHHGESRLKFTLSLSRKPLYASFNILLPVVVLCALNSVVFLLPEESGERVGFSSTLFLSFMVCLNTVMDIMPRSSSPVSYLCFYLVVMMSTSAVMTLATVLLSRVYHQPEKSEVPKWMSRLVTFIQCRCHKLRCCVLLCRAIGNKCCDRDKRKRKTRCSPKALSCNPRSANKLCIPIVNVIKSRERESKREGCVDDNDKSDVLDDSNMPKERITSPAYSGTSGAKIVDPEKSQQKPNTILDEGKRPSRNDAKISPKANVILSKISSDKKARHLSNEPNIPTVSDTPAVPTTDREKLKRKRPSAKETNNRKGNSTDAAECDANKTEKVSEVNEGDVPTTSKGISNVATFYDKSSRKKDKMPVTQIQSIADPNNEGDHRESKIIHGKQKDQHDSRKVTTETTSKSTVHDKSDAETNEKEITSTPEKNTNKQPRLRPERVVRSNSSNAIIHKKGKLKINNSAKPLTKKLLAHVSQQEINTVKTIRTDDETDSSVPTEARCLDADSIVSEQDNDPVEMHKNVLGFVKNDPKRQNMFMKSEVVSTKNLFKTIAEFTVLVKTRSRKSRNRTAIDVPLDLANYQTKEADHKVKLAVKAKGSGTSDYDDTSMSEDEELYEMPSASDTCIDETSDQGDNMTDDESGGIDMKCDEQEVEHKENVVEDEKLVNNQEDNQILSQKMTDTITIENNGEHLEVSTKETPKNNDNYKSNFDVEKSDTVPVTKEKEAKLSALRNLRSQASLVKQMKHKINSAKKNISSPSKGKAVSRITTSKKVTKTAVKTTKGPVQRRKSVTAGQVNQGQKTVPKTGTPMNDKTGVKKPLKRETSRIKPQLTERKKSVVNLTKTPVELAEEIDEEPEDDGLNPDVEWADVGRILDFFFFLAFLGLQIFLTIVFFVPIATN